MKIQKNPPKTYGTIIKMLSKLSAFKYSQLSSQEHAVQPYEYLLHRQGTIIVQVISFFISFSVEQFISLPIEHHISYDDWFDIL